MRTRTTIALAVIAAILVVMTFVLRDCERKGESIRSGAIFPGLKRDLVARIELASAADTVRLHREAGRWRVATEGDAPADTAAVRGLLEKLAGFDRRYRVSANPEMQQTFEVDEASGTGVRLLDAGGGELAAFRLGKNGPDFRSQYLRPAASSEVFLIPDYLRGSFDAQRATWRERTIFAFDPQRVQHLTISAEQAPPVEIGRTAEGAFVILAPDSLPAKRSLVEATIRSLATLRADAFPEGPVSLADAGLAPPLQEVAVALEDGGRHALRIGRETEDARVYVAREGDETVFLLSKGRLGSLVRSLETLKEEPPAPEAAPS